MQEEINQTLLDNIYQVHKRRIGNKLFDFLFSSITPITINNETIIFLTDDFTLNFFSTTSSNYISLKKSCSEILYTNDFTLIFDNINNKNKYLNNIYNNIDIHNINTDSKILTDTIKTPNINNELDKQHINNIDTNNNNNSINNKLISSNEDSTNEETNIRKKSFINKDEDSYTNNFLNEYVSKNTISNYEQFEQNTFLNQQSNDNLKYEKTKLVSNMNFKNFFYSYENQQIIKGAKLLIKEINSPPFNPFFLYGVSGIGKTHLLHAIGNEIFNLNLNKNILYLHSTSFVEEYTSLFKGGINNTEKIEEFQEKYSNIDVLLIDDIQLLESKEGSLNEFFAIFEKLRNNNKIIIIASDKHPNKIHFEERLISRFISGLTIEVKLPDTDTKKQIFIHHALERDIDVEEDAVSVFIDNSTNVRTLLGYLNAITLLIITHDLNNIKITKSEALKILNSSDGKANKITEDDIIEIITNHFNISKKELLSKSRKKNIVTARHFCAYFLRYTLEYKQRKISYILNFNDHSAALNAIKSAKQKINNKEYKKDFNKISQILSR